MKMFKVSTENAVIGPSVFPAKTFEDVIRIVTGNLSDPAQEQTTKVTIERTTAEKEGWYVDPAAMV